MPDFLDTLRVNYHYLRKVGRLPNLKAPTTFTEKVQVAKLTWRSPRMPELADKVLAKHRVTEILGSDWVTPTLYAGRALPQQRDWGGPYVIKCNHRSGLNHFIMDDRQDWPAIERSVQRQLAATYGRRLAEWVYTQIDPQVLLEPFIGDGTPPTDYKIYVFGGKAMFTSVNWDRHEQVKRATFDREWKRLPFVMNEIRNDYPGADLPLRPDSYAAMLDGAEELARGFPFARVDLYEIDGRPRFGEVTFYPQSGLFRMLPEYDRWTGSLWPDGLPL